EAVTEMAEVVAGLLGGSFGGTLGAPMDDSAGDRSAQRGADGKWKQGSHCSMLSGPRAPGPIYRRRADGPQRAVRRFLVRPGLSRRWVGRSSRIILAEDLCKVAVDPLVNGRGARWLDPVGPGEQDQAGEA